MLWMPFITGFPFLLLTYVHACKVGHGFISANCCKRIALGARSKISGHLGRVSDQVVLSCIWKEEGKNKMTQNWWCKCNDWYDTPYKKWLYNCQSNND